MKPFVADVVLDSERLLKQVVRVCGEIPQKYKSVLATRLMELALVSLVRGQDAARVGVNKGQDQQKKLQKQQLLVAELLDSNHKLQALLDVAYELNAFASHEHYSELLQLADKVGAKAGGWLKQIKAALPVKQISEPSDQLQILIEALKRLGALSTDAASAEAKS